MKILNSGIEVYDYNPSPQKTMIRLLCIQVQFEIYSNFHSSLGSRGRQSEKKEEGEEEKEGGRERQISSSSVTIKQKQKQKADNIIGRRKERFKIQE